MRLLNKIIILIIVCYLFMTQTIAQSLNEIEVSAIVDRAFELGKEKKYAEAIEAFLIVGSNTEQQRTDAERDVYVISQTMACLYYELTGCYRESYLLAKKLLSGKLKKSEKDLLYDQYVRSGFLYVKSLIKGDDKSISDYQEAREILIEIAPFANGQQKEYVLQGIPSMWYKEGVMYYLQDELDEALVCFEKASNGFNDLNLTKNELLSLIQIASIHSYLYDIDKAIRNYEEALSLSEKINKDDFQLEILDDLLRLYEIAGDMDKVAECDKLIYSLFEKTDDKQVKFEYYVNKGKEAYKQGLYNLAEQWLLKSKVIIEGQDDAVVNDNRYIVYSNLRDVYLKSGSYDEALDFAMLALEESKRISSYNIAGYYMSYISIAEIYCATKDKINCYKYLDSLFLVESYLEEPRALSKLYVIRGDSYNKFGQYDAALADYKKADEVLDSQYPVFDVERVWLYPVIGKIENKLNHYVESEYYYKLYSDAIKDIFGKNSVDYINSQIYLSNAQGFAGNVEAGCQNYSKAVNNLKYMIKTRLPYMNTIERESFWGPLSSLLTDMTPYALEAELYQTDFTKICYEALLMSKAFLLNTEKSLYEIIQKEGSDIDKDSYIKISSINMKIKEWEKDYSIHADSLLAAYDKVNKLETDLMNKFKSFGDITSFIDVNYSNVKNALKKNEYLIDFTDFVSKSQGRKYAAYFLEKKQKYPLLMPLFTEKQIDSLGIVCPDMFYDKDFFSDVIRLLWEPIKEYVKEGATIYYVPSQLIFQICLESLPLDDGTLLGEHYNFVRLSSARELLKENRNNDKSSAVLYGGLQYDIEPELMVENAKQYDISSLMAMRGNIVRGNADFNELPGSKVEVETIKEILKKDDFDVTLYSGVNGTEESFLNLNGKSPRILHLATHGFYYTPSEADRVNYLKGYTDAMSLSGLIMSGGNAAWQGEELPDGVLGGVITANNIARLDLRSTDLVVLSACQSGQGNATAEGLYGLQRAFKKAGVGTIVMTLWNVSDKVTTEFMMEFYERLSENNWDKRKAFEETKTVIRKQYPDPYYWAAFVMLD